MTDLQCQKFHYGGHKMRILGHVTTAVQTIQNGFTAGNYQFSAKVVLDLNKNLDTFSIAGHKMSKQLSKDSPVAADQSSPDTSTPPTCSGSPTPAASWSPTPDSITTPKPQRSPKQKKPSQKSKPVTPPRPKPSPTTSPQGRPSPTTFMSPSRPLFSPSAPLVGVLNHVVVKPDENKSSPDDPQPQLGALLGDDLSWIIERDLARLNQLKPEKPTSSFSPDEDIMCDLCFYDGKPISITKSHTNNCPTCPSMTNEAKFILYGPNWRTIAREIFEERHRRKKEELRRPT